MAKDEQETKASMAAYNGLKTAAKQLEAMAHASEPDLDKMLEEVKRAKRHYDQCNAVIKSIKAQVDSIFDESPGTEDGQPDLAQASKLLGAVGQGGNSKLAEKRDDLDDEIPF